MKFSVAGFPGGQPIKVITDSIGKALPSIRNCSHELKSGCTIRGITDDILCRRLLLGGLRVVVFHIGTNSLDARAWSRRTTWRVRLNELRAEILSLYQAVRQCNRSAFIIFSAVLPRKCDWEFTKYLYVEFNTALCSFARSRSCGFMPTYRGFIHGEGSMKGQPLAHLFAHRDGGLHLSLSGRYIFTERFKSALGIKSITTMARNIKFI